MGGQGRLSGDMRCDSDGFFSFFRCVRSEFHHCLECRTGLNSGIASSIVSCNTCVMRLTAVLNSSLFSISLGARWFAKFAVSCSLNSCQFVVRKFQYKGGWLWAAWMSIMVWIGMWSVPGPHRRGQVSHFVIDSSRLSVQNTLSTLVQFPVTMDCSVGSFLGSVLRSSALMPRRHRTEFSGTVWIGPGCPGPSERPSFCPTDLPRVFWNPLKLLVFGMYTQSPKV